MHGFCALCMLKVCCGPARICYLGPTKVERVFYGLTWSLVYYRPGGSGEREVNGNFIISLGWLFQPIPRRLLGSFLDLGNSY